MKVPAHRIEYSPETEEHLAWLTVRQAATVMDTVERQLRHQPTVAARNRKLLRANPMAPWELRIGDLRVYYEVRVAPERVVVIKAIGLKERSRVRIGGEEVEL